MEPIAECVLLILPLQGFSAYFTIALDVPTPFYQRSKIVFLTIQVELQ